MATRYGKKAQEKVDVALPRGAARVGSFLFDGKAVRFQDASGNVRPMRTDTSGTPDIDPPRWWETGLSSGGAP